MGLPFLQRSSEIAPRTAEFDDTPSGILLASLRDGVVKLEAVEAAFMALKGVHGQVAAHLTGGYLRASKFSGEVGEARAAAIQEVEAAYPEADRIEEWLGTDVVLRRPARYSPKRSFLTGRFKTPDNDLWLAGIPDYSLRHSPQAVSSGKISEGVTLYGRVANISPANSGTIVLEDGYTEIIGSDGAQISNAASPFSQFERAWIERIFDSRHRSGIEVAAQQVPRPVDDEQLTVALSFC